jgi:hypothetical protein
MLGDPTPKTARRIRRETRSSVEDAVTAAEDHRDLTSSRFSMRLRKSRARHVVQGSSAIPCGLLSVFWLVPELELVKFG